MSAPQGLLKTSQSKKNSHLKLSIQYLGHHFKSIYQKSAKFDDVPWQAKARLRFRSLGLLRLLKVIYIYLKNYRLIPSAQPVLTSLLSMKQTWPGRLRPKPLMPHADPSSYYFLLVVALFCHLGRFGLLFGFRWQMNYWLTVCYSKGVHCWVLLCNHRTYADLSRSAFLSFVALCNLGNGLLLEHPLVKTTHWTTLCDCKDAHLLFLFGMLPSGLSGAAKTKTSDLILAHTNHCRFTLF